MLMLRRIEIGFLTAVFTAAGISLGVISVVLASATAEAQTVVEGTTTDTLHGPKITSGNGGGVGASV